MKKIIGIFGVAVIAATMFFSANNVNSSSSDTSLASLIAMNTANAETLASGCRYTGFANDRCVLTFISVTNCANNTTATNCYYN